MAKVANMALQRPVRICASSDVRESACGVRFPVELSSASAAERQLTGFVVRYRGKARAYLNQCAHIPSELDWQPGEFFDHSGLYLMCATHGAVYEPETGRCAGGPCRGAPLRAIPTLEHGGSIFWQPDDVLRACDNET